MFKTSVVSKFTDCIACTVQYINMLISHIYYFYEASYINIYNVFLHRSALHIPRVEEVKKIKVNPAVQTHTPTPTPAPHNNNYNSKPSRESEKENTQPKTTTAPSPAPAAPSEPPTPPPPNPWRTSLRKTNSRVSLLE